MSSLKGCDALAKGTWIGEGAGAGVKEVSVPHRERRRLSESAPWMKSLRSARRRAGRFYKSSGDTHGSRRLTVSERKNQRKKEKCTQRGRLFPRRMIFF